MLMQFRPCPHCCAALASNVDLSVQPPPKPGDITLCFNCGGWAVLTDQGLRLPTPDDYQVIAEERGCQRLLRTWRSLYPDAPAGMRKASGLDREH